MSATVSRGRLTGNEIEREEKPLGKRVLRFLAGDRAPLANAWIVLKGEPTITEMRLLTGDPATAAERSEKLRPEFEAVVDEWQRLARDPERAGELEEFRARFIANIANIPEAISETEENGDGRQEGTSIS